VLAIRRSTASATEPQFIQKRGNNGAQPRQGLFGDPPHVSALDRGIATDKQIAERDVGQYMGEEEGRKIHHGGTEKKAESGL